MSAVLTPIATPSAAGPKRSEGVWRAAWRRLRKDRVGVASLGVFFCGKVVDFLEWLYTVFTSIPDLLLILSFAVIFGLGIGSVAIILALVGWTGMYRQVRAEFIKHSTRDYVRSAEAIGASTA